MIRLSPARAGAGIAAAAIVGIALAHLYERVSTVSGLLPWQAAASIHTMLAAVVLWRCQRHRQLPVLLDWRAPLWTYMPAAVVTLGAIVAALLTAFFWPPAEGSSLYAIPWAYVAWIPIVEELVFRVGFGAVWRAHLGNIWGAWLSAVLFALAHAAPTLPNLMAGQVGLPLGPFLLALACEALIIKSGRLLPVVLLHAACNGTVFIFSQLDSRWLKWLGLLYL